MSGNLLRSCAGCSAHILTNDGRSQDAYCPKCRPKYVKPFGEWAAALKAGDICYVQPILAWRGLTFSKNLVIGRDGDQVTVQILGMPESRQTIHIAQLADHNLTPRGRWRQ
jgi:hypothetical protein